MTVSYVISTAKRDLMVKTLGEIEAMCERVKQRTKRSRKMRDSEKAMSLAAIDRQVEALGMGANALRGKVTVSSDPEIEAEDHV